MGSKNVCVSDETWDRLSDLKRKYKLKSLNEIIEALLNYTESLIKKGEITLQN